MADSHASPTHFVAEPHAAPHDDAHDVAKHVKGYLMVGAVLFAFTILTVFLSYVDFGSQNRNIVIAMIVATFKAGLVAAIFMHLKGERATVWRLLFFTAIFVAGLFLLTWFHEADPIPGTFKLIH